jgi:hypothetical protein
MGERPEEVVEALRDIREVDVDLMTLGQYLQPTTYHLPVDRWVTPAQFAEHARAAWRSASPMWRPGHWSVPRTTRASSSIVPRSARPRSPDGPWIG